MSLEEAIGRRRSGRDFSPESISQPQLSQMLWAAQGITDTSRRCRTVPSAGATYPLEIFIVCSRNGIDGVDGGIYRYNPDSNSLILHHKGDARFELARAALDEESIYKAPADMVMCAVYERTTMRYGSRGERYIHMEAGHAGQNVYLQATALGLAIVAIGAFYDEQVRKILRLDKQIEPLYIIPVGKPA